MEDSIQKKARAFIKQCFYYLEYPGRMPEGFWKDKTGRLHSIMSMNQEELKECIRRIDQDLDQFEDLVLDETQEQALNLLRPLAHDLKNTLEDELAFQEQETAKAREKNRRELEEELEFGRITRGLPEYLKKRNLTIALPKWMIDRLADEEGTPGDVIERRLYQIGFRPPGEEDAEPLEAEDIEVISGPETVLTPMLKHALESILRFSRLALSYDFPKATLVNYIRLIDKAAQRLLDEIEKRGAT
jgi:hypothetical protein